MYIIFSVCLFIRWSQQFLRSSQHFRSRGYVLVLSPRRTRSTSSTLPLVEEIPDHAANDTICGGDVARFSTVVHRLRISQGIRLAYWIARGAILLPVS